jgi:hypothetical protein
MIAATKEKLDELMLIAQDLVALGSGPLRVIRFHQREDFAMVTTAPPAPPS